MVKKPEQTERCNKFLNTFIKHNFKMAIITVFQTKRKHTVITVMNSTDVVQTTNECTSESINSLKDHNFIEINIFWHVTQYTIILT